MQLLLQIEESLVEIPAPVEQAPASHQIDQQVRRWLNEAITASPHSRDEIASTMSLLAGRQITKPMLDTWTGTQRPNRMPLDLVGAFCAAAGNNHLAERVMASMGLAVMNTAEATLARMGQWQLVVVRALEEQRALAEGLPVFPRRAA